MNKWLVNLIKPESNILAGGIAGVIVFLIVHLLTYLGVALTPDQANQLSVTTASMAAYVVAHLCDVYDKSTPPPPAPQVKNP